jgi:hypothetical protein
MKNLKYFLLAFMAISFVISGCNKDEDGDTTKPFIELLGYDPVYTPVGLPYVDAGAIAWDVTMEGDTLDITDRMVTTDNVNVNLAGNYEVTYNVTDEEGNAADERKRSIKVVIGK